MFKSSILILAMSCGIHGFLKLPPYIKACSKSNPNFNECAKKHGQDALPHFIKGDPKYHIPILDPLELSKVNLEASDNIKLYATDLKLYGLKDTEIVDFDVNFDTRTLKVKLYCPTFTIVGQYNMEGHILIMNLKGSGPMNNSHFDNEFNFMLTYDTKSINNKTYADLKATEINLNVKGTHFQFENLLNNNEISKQMNIFLNENWQMLMVDLLPSINLIIKDVFLSILKPLAAKIPLEEVFTD